VKPRRLLFSVFTLAVLASTIGVTGLGTSAAVASGSTTVRTIHRLSQVGPFQTRASRSTPSAGPHRSDLPTMRKVSSQFLGDETEGSNSTPNVQPTKPTQVAGPSAASPFKVAASFNGLDALDSETVNLFDLEPPDQGMCAGHGKVLEVLNDVVGVYDGSGTLLTAPISLNAFYGYGPAFDATSNTFGPFMTDPSCVFDPGTNRWYVSELTLEVDPTNGPPDFTGLNHLDIAVSATADPLGKWNVYQIPAQDDGTQGTPNHNCTPTPSEIPPDATNPNACLGDYPQLGTDGNGVYVTTNEYTFFEPTGLALHAAQLYAMPKYALAKGSADVPLVQIDTQGMVRGTQSGFTLKPARAPGREWSSDSKGTEYFLSSNAAAEVSSTGSSSDLIVWALGNTASLGTNQAVVLRHRIVTVRTYAEPPAQHQKPGPLPIADCLNDTTVQTQEGPGCWRIYGLTTQPPHQVEGDVSPVDSRVMTAWFQGGTLYGALDSAARIAQPGGTTTKVGVAWFVLHASNRSGMHAKLVNQGVISVADNNLSMPAIAVPSGGHGVMGMSLMGDDFYPSAVWTTFGARGPGKVHVVAKGKGPYDGFGAYPPLSGTSDTTLRWGDYGAATVAGSSLWIANEWIGQRCTFDQWLGGDLTCNGTRTPFENWFTRITRLKPTG
jgi:hypothetical protein